MITYNEALTILATNNRAKIKLVKELLEEASRCYYNTDTVILTDGEYDELYNRYNTLTGDIIIGALPDGKGTINIEHSYEDSVGTLDKCFTFDQAEIWIRGICDKYFDLLEYMVRFSIKFDGNSVTFEFDKDGNMQRALTRGKNGKGKDLTHVFRGYKSNLKLDTEYAIKYEAIVTYENYDKICQMYDADYANPRSLVSGLLGKDEARKYRDFITLVPLKVKPKKAT